MVSSNISWTRRWPKTILTSISVLDGTRIWPWPFCRSRSWVKVCKDPQKTHVHVVWVQHVQYEKNPCWSTSRPCTINHWDLFYLHWLPIPIPSPKIIMVFPTNLNVSLMVFPTNLSIYLMVFPTNLSVSLMVFPTNLSVSLMVFPKYVSCSSSSSACCGACASTSCRQRSWMSGCWAIAIRNHVIAEAVVLEQNIDMK